MFKEFTITTDKNKEYMWYVLIDDEFKTLLFRYSVYQYELHHHEIIGRRHGKKVFNNFLNAFYDEYNKRKKNPAPNMVKLMTNYFSNKGYAARNSTNTIKEFLKSKNVDYEKYLLLL